ncbi:MAG: pyrroline-5-carboxylate reductase [Actinobacteria bacterium]|nr:pyrroline-5-carboxylate reductase [Actinomycetota bacterium]
MSAEIAFVGAGAMGGAMIRGLLSRGVAQPSEIIVNEVDTVRRDALVRDYAVRPGVGVPEGLRTARVVILAIKPQTFPTLAPDVRAGLDDGKVLISIMAGVTLRALTDGLGTTRLVRAMPNMPAQIGRGVTVWTPGRGATPDDLALAERLLGALGMQVHVDGEKDIDAATAVHASGPAYAFLVAEAWIDAAVAIGLSRPLAEALVRETLIGSLALWAERGQSPAALRHAVTSPGGTTAAALDTFEDYRLRAAFGAAIRAAHQRARELG